MNELERRLWARVMRFGPMLRFVPGVRMVAVCNSLALGEVNEQSDIDLFIVARAGWLFRVRFLSVLLMQILGVRRYGKKVAGRFCLSFYVDDSRLFLGDLKVDADYLARWIGSLKPIVDDSVSAEFERMNGVRLDRSRALWRPFRFVWLPVFLERFFRWWQFRRHERNLAHLESGHDVVVSDGMLKFYRTKERRSFKL